MQVLSATPSVSRPRKRKQTLSAVHPNPGVAAAYRRKLDLLLGEMHNSVHYWIGVAYRQNEPNTIAQDEAPAVALGRILTALARRWNRKFKDAAPELAAYFATSTKDRADGALKLILRKSGFSVSFTTTPASRDAFTATVGENVSLIKSIGAQYLSDVEQAVMRSVAAGRDLKSLYDEIGDKVDLSLIGKGRKPGESDKSLLARTRRRAALIARDQNNKATATILRVRQQGLGITQAVWLHSGGGKEPRPEHVAWGKGHVRYDLAKGMWSEKDQKYVWPGTAINCRCVSVPVIPGFEDDYAADSVAHDAATWMESQHPRDENGQFSTVSNGHTKPKQGSITGKVWDLADLISNKKKGYATSAEVKAEAAKLGLNPNMTQTQFYRWKKFHSKVEGAPKSVEINTSGKPMVSKKEISDLQKAVKPAPKVAEGDKAMVLAKTLHQKYGFEFDLSKSNERVTAHSLGGYTLRYWYDSGAYRLLNADGVALAEGAGYLNAINAVQDLMESDAAPAASPSPSAPAAPPPTSPNGIVSTLDTIMGPILDFKKEGVFGGIHYYVKGAKKVSYKPLTNSWAMLEKKPGNAAFSNVTSGVDFDKLKGMLDQLGATNAHLVAAQHKMQKAASAAAFVPVPVEKVGYTEGIPHTDHLPATLRSSITTYTGSTYRSINGALRNPSKSTAPEILKHISNIQKAFALSPPTKKGTVVKRGFDFDGLKGMAESAGLASIDQMAVGMTLVDKGFVSTTHKTQATFGSIKTEITVPVGAKALHIAPISLHQTENETLLPSGSKFIIESIDKHAITGHISSLRLRMVVQ